MISELQRLHSLMDGTVWHHIISSHNCTVDYRTADEVHVTFTDGHGETYLFTTFLYWFLEGKSVADL